jgi:hypothetical protein
MKSKEKTTLSEPSETGIILSLGDYDAFKTRLTALRDQ